MEKIATAPTIIGARANMVSGLTPRSRPKSREAPPAASSGSAADAAIAALAMNGGQPSMPVSDSSRGPAPNPAANAAA